jgi:hypothetical protein
VFPCPLDAAFRLHDEARLRSLILLLAAVKVLADVVVRIQLRCRERRHLGGLELPRILVVGIQDGTPDGRALLDGETGYLCKTRVEKESRISRYLPGAATLLLEETGLTSGLSTDNDGFSLVLSRTVTVATGG